MSVQRLFFHNSHDITSQLFYLATPIQDTPHSTAHMYALCVTGSYLTHVYKIPYPQKLFQLWLGGSLCVSMCMCEICHHNVFNQRADVSMTDSWSESKNKVVVSVSNSFSDFFFPSSYKVTYPTVTICFSADKVGKDSTTAAC